MVLLDNYRASGSGYESFVAELEDFEKNTAMYRISNCGITLLSFKEKDNGLYSFYKIDMESVAQFNNGNTTIPVVKIPARTQEDIDMFTEVEKTSGLLLLYGKLIMFVSQDAVSSLAERAEVRGNQLQRYSLARNLFIAEGLFNPEKRGKDGKPLQSTLICRRQQITNNQNAFIRKVFADMGERFVYSPLSNMKKVIDAVFENHPFGPCEVKKWMFTHKEASVQVEFPAMGKKIQENYNLPHKLIPGFMLVDSDTGHSSFKVRTTFRIEGAKEAAYLDEKQWNHTSPIKVNEIVSYVSEEVVEDFYDVPESLFAKTKKPISPKKADATFRKWSRELQITGAIGKKNEQILMKQLKESVPVDGLNEYKLARAFLTSIEGQKLLPYAEENLRLAVGKAPFIGGKDLVVKWEN